MPDINGLLNAVLDTTGSALRTTGATSGVASGSVATVTLSNVAGSASSVQLVAANTGRSALYVFNDSTSAVYVKYGTTASATSFTVKIAAAGFWEMPVRPVYTGRVDAIWDTATGSARVTEL